MIKVFHIARRDFIATVTTRGFIIAVMFPLLMYGLIGVLFPRLMNDRAPQVSGEIAIVDLSGKTAEQVVHSLSKDAITERRRADLARARAAAVPSTSAAPAAPLTRALDDLVGPIPDFTVVTLSPDASVAVEKSALKAGGSSDGRLALIVVHPDAVVPAAGANTYGSYDLFIRPSLDDRVVGTISTGMEYALIAARSGAEGLDWRHIDALSTVVRPRAVTVTDRAESETATIFTRILPLAFMVLLMMSVMSSGQYLMTTTIEEKSSRTMEVILSAVSPMQLMAGKVLGQLAVGLLVLALYSSVSLLALFSMALVGFLDLSLLWYLLAYFLITYFIIGSLMAAVGSAVNELREAQALMMPITMTMMIPWLFWLPIVRDPNSMFSTTLSFVPPISSFAMLLRLTSSSPPPMWQVWLSMGIGVAAAAAALWFASRVFKIGLLMYGRPPNFATLLRWARAK